MSSRLCRTILLSAALLALAATTPALSDPVPAAAPDPTLQAPSGCALSFELGTPNTEASVCKPPVVQTPIDAQPEFMAQGFHGYCRCTCSLIKNCNTSADCGGSPCLGGPTCC